METSFLVIIITGLSGSGKSTALHVFEDMDFFTVDGLPAALIPQIVGVFSQAYHSHPYKGIVIGLDLRQSNFYEEYAKSIALLQEQGFAPKLVFMEAKTESLMQRYATTRRPHPLEKEGLGLEQALETEKTRLSNLRKDADLVLDTSAYSIHDLRRSLQNKWASLCTQHSRQLRVHIISFGFKYGTPSEADMVFDLRFLPNPYFIPELRPLSGKDKSIASFVLEQEPGKTFTQKLQEFVVYTLQENEKEGRFRLTIAIGCTGGRHRSVAVAEQLNNELKKQGFVTSLEHRHLELG